MLFLPSQTRFPHGRQQSQPTDIYLFGGKQQAGYKQTHPEQWGNRCCPAYRDRMEMEKRENRWPAVQSLQ